MQSKQAYSFLEFEGVGQLTFKVITKYSDSSMSISQSILSVDRYSCIDIFSHIPICSIFMSSQGNRIYQN